MKRITLLTIVACISLLSANAQQTGSFETIIQFNGTQHTLAYFVPPNYNSANSYPLIVGLHGCGGIATAFRSSLIATSVAYEAIILCPDFMGNQISGADGQIIPNSIDTTINAYGYNIDTTAVYLTGFSCNGQETFKQGWNKVYPFRGIIPFNAWIPSITPDYNFDSDIPTCICTGDQDGSYQNNIALYDSLIAHMGTGKLNSLPGIGHLWYYAGRDAELQKCINWIDSVSGHTTSINDPDNQESDIRIFPNPARNTLTISNIDESISNEILIYDLHGRKVIETELQNDAIDISALQPGLYIVEIVSKELKLRKKLIIR